MFVANQKRIPENLLDESDDIPKVGEILPPLNSKRKEIQEKKSLTTAFVNFAMYNMNLGRISCA